jgi:hypothetical protein
MHQAECIQVPSEQPKYSCFSLVIKGLNSRETGFKGDKEVMHVSARLTRRLQHIFSYEKNVTSFTALQSKFKEAFLCLHSTITPLLKEICYPF